jgi:glycosyltransferase involved in cell wall biosynthesis
MTKKDILLERALLKENIKLISHQGYIGNEASIKSVGWIPDFQHKHLKENFSKIERHKRDMIFEKICQASDSILVSSESALNDLFQFYPDHADKGRVLKFIGNFPEKPPISLNTIQEKYRLSGPYFYVPNQFWKHKNHKLILVALKILRNSDIHPVILCSGNTKDVNNPEHFKLLKNDIEDNGLQHQFRILGEIVYQDVISLTYHALAIINPSLFEGWSTIVEESRNLNKHQILSNIDVHIEQAPDNTIYINPNKPEDLASAIRTMLDKADKIKQIEWNELIHRYEFRKEKFAREYQNILIQALSE